MNSLFLGYDANRRPIRLRPDDRNIHMHVIGSSGSGKSKFLEWMMRGDLKNRQGFALLDPHGTLYNDVVSYCSHRVLDRDIILLNLSSPDAVIGFNPFQRNSEGNVSVQVDRRIAATMHAWGVDNTDQTPTLERTLRLIYTVMVDQNLCLPQIAHLIDFNAQEIRGRLIENLQTPLIQKEWQELQGMRHKEWRDETLSARNRLFRFLTSPALTRFMGLQNRSIDLKAVMDQGKILLVNLAPSDYLSEENARVFGALLVNEFFETARRRRRDESGHDPAPYFLYMDEFQSFVSLDIADMLDQVRKFGLFTILAHQRFGHLDENITDAVLTNCRIKAVFGGLPVQSARLMAEELFIGELDPKKIKVAIYQTKFWPEYRRDKVYTRGTTHSSSSGFSEGSSSGYSTGSSYGTTSGQFFEAGDWFSTSDPAGSSAGTSRSTSSGYSSNSSSGSSSSDSTGTSESEADIPILIPVPFEELSSVQYFTTEEQLLQLTAGLKEQFPRHCFIKIHSEKTQAMLVPLVESFYTPQEGQKWYQDKLLKGYDALSAAQADALIASQETALLQTPAATQTIDLQPALEPEPAPLPVPTEVPLWTRQPAKKPKNNSQALFFRSQLKSQVAMPHKLFSKFKQPEQPSRGSQISERDLDIIETILNFRFCPTAELVRLVGGNEDVTYRRLRLLWEKGLVKRFAFNRTSSQLYYYLDSKDALDLLLLHKRLAEPHPQMLEEIRNNREKDYASAAYRGSEGQLMFLRHELMLSRLHFMLEMAARASDGKLQLQAWVQGAQLQGHKVELPRLRATRPPGVNEYLWQEMDDTERLPVEPDALFTLRFADRPPEQQLANFCYEADRGTMTTTDMTKKFRAYFHFIKKQQKHVQAFGVHPIRAVLIETTDEARGEKLMQLVNHPLVCGPQKRAGLFWFTISSLFTTAEAPGLAALPYLTTPEMIMERIWAVPSRTMLALGDVENSPVPATKGL